ncbi:ATP-binding protein [Pseudoalteromonas sp. MMG022]|uniref:ATP-binding protein n=1 Tax=Pseudoalteromonas sp. MMG022 TaxID=2909978 RepID=UPI001F3039DB|nr:ATP-binding protein [Pseudoalteromonas sp. MMG022]MCF6435632.1 ATP-binding protein [Pseudoalteromonas sp. MMG022]
MKRSVFNKLVTPISIVFTLAISVLIYFTDQRIKTNALEQVSDELQFTLLSAKQKVNDGIDARRKDIQFLYATPPISGLARASNNDGFDPKDNTTTEQWKIRLETIFVSMLKNHPELDQLRVINAQGMEIIRVDRLSGRIEVYGGNLLQDKSQSSYMKTSAKLKRNQLYISPISLNKEHGEFEFPYRLAQRFVKPIFDDNNALFGFLVMNVNPKGLLSELNMGNKDTSKIIILNQQRQIIWHPEEQFRFSADLQPELVWPHMVHVGISPSEAFELSWQGEAIFAKAVEVPLTKGAASQSLIAISYAPEQTYNQLVYDNRLSTYALIVIVLTLVAIFIVVLSFQYYNKNKLAESRSVFSAIVNGSLDVIIALDSSGQIMTWNRAASKLFGVSEDYVVGNKLNHIIGDKLSDLPQKLLHVLESGASIQEEVDIEIDNEHRSYNMVVSPAKEADLTGTPKLIGVALILQDITQERIAQEKVVSINASLEKQIQERTSELAQAHKQALKASDVKSAFVSNISHEMRTPLNGISGMLSLINREALSKKQQQYMKMAQSSAESLATLVNDILDLSKIEAGKLEIDNKPFDLLGLLENVMASLAVRAFDSSTELILDIEKLQHRVVDGDALRLNQILFNLIGNAIKFTENGNVTLQASSYAIDDDQVEVRIDVIDTGIGIAKENFDKIFSKFDQETSGTSQKYGGTGLGLSISKQLAELMNGDITFGSEKGVGSTFTLQLKYEKNSCQALSVPKILAEKNVIFACENEVVCKSALAILKRLGASEVQIHHQANEDLKSALVGHSCDWLIIDNNIPNLSHWFEQWQQYPQGSCKVALMKAPASNNIEIDYEPAILIDKPITLSELSNKLQSSSSSASTSTSALTATNSSIELLDASLERIHGLNILAVDDNDINLEVLKGFLAPLEINITTAKDGLQAIATLKEHASELDIVLMDCSMPNMDGYEATKSIRRGDAGKRYVDIPIIAMTANAMSGEKDKCVAAGMSDYIAKPMTINTLTQAITKYAPDNNKNAKSPPERVNTDSNGKPSSPSEKDDRLEKDADVWDIENVLSRLMGDKKLHNQLVKMFLDSLPERIEEIQSAVEQQSLNDIRITSHRLRGAAGDVGAIGIGRVCAELEKAAINDDLEGCKRLHKQFLEQVEALSKTAKFEQWKLDAVVN